MEKACRNLIVADGREREMRTSTPVRTGVRAAASSWKPRSLAVVWMDGQSPDVWPGGVDGALLKSPCHLLFSLSPLLLLRPPLPLLCLYIGMSPVTSRGSLFYTSVNKFVLGGVEQVFVLQIN